MSKDKIYYMTPQCHKKMVDEREHLLRVERPEVCKVVAWAAGNGDRSENADYIYGKKRLREIDRRLRFLGSRLDKSQVVNPENIHSDKVQFGATVKVQYESGEDKTFSIVGVDKIDTKLGHISYMSPIGKALIGKEQGDSIELSTPKGRIEFEIVEISYLKINKED